MTERNKYIWSTRDGHRYTLDEMDDVYVGNTIKWIERVPIKNRLDPARYMRVIKKDGHTMGEWIAAFRMELALRFYSYNTHRGTK